MKDNKSIIAAALVAASIIVLGLCLKSGIDNFVDKDRRVEVKGLSEREVEANKVTWPIIVRATGNDLAQLYTQIRAMQQTVKEFLTAGGILEDDISLCAPDVNDLDDDYWRDKKPDYRYIVTASVIVVSTDVAKVNDMIDQKGELLNRGIAFSEGRTEYTYTSFQEMKPQMMEEAIANAENTAKQFAKNSHSTLNKIVRADQGYFSIDDRDDYTPHVKKLRVVTTVVYSLKD